MTRIVDPVDTLTRGLDLASNVVDRSADRVWANWIPGGDPGRDTTVLAVPGRHSFGSTLLVTRIAPKPWFGAEEALADHIAMWDPYTVSNLVTAGRRLLKLHRPALPPHADWCAVCGEGGQMMDCTFPCDTVRILALGLVGLVADHAGPAVTS